MTTIPRFLVLVYLVAMPIWDEASACYSTPREKCIDKASSDFKACCRSKRLPLRVDSVCDYDYMYDKLSTSNPEPRWSWLKSTFELFDTPIPNQQQVVADFIECFNRGVDNTDCCLNPCHRQLITP
jgi:hypothetical protein